MPTTSEDLHGMVPENSTTVLLLIDVINDLDFPGNEELIENVEQMAKRLSVLKRKLKSAGCPAIYVNDNFNRWQSNFQSLLDHCLNTKGPVKRATELLIPEEDDYFVLKPKHSGFYCTPLEILLEHFGATDIILTGIAGNICVLYTANDAYMRGYRLFVPEDVVLSNSRPENGYALDQMRKLLKADTTDSGSLLSVLRLPQEKGSQPVHA